VREAALIAIILLISDHACLANYRRPLSRCQEIFLRFPGFSSGGVLETCEPLFAVVGVKEHLHGEGFPWVPPLRCTHAQKRGAQGNGEWENGSWRTSDG